MKKIFIFPFLISLSYGQTVTTSNFAPDARLVALGNSSLVWLKSPSSIWINPAELVNVKATQLAFYHQKFYNNSMIGASHLFPLYGTAGFSAIQIGTLEAYSFGIGRHLMENVTGGASLNYLRSLDQKQGTLTVGFSFQTPENLKWINNRLRAGLVFQNFSLFKKSSSSLEDFTTKIGVSCEAIPDFLNFFVSYYKFSNLGVEIFPLDWLAIRAGTQKFEDNFYGVGFLGSNYSIDMTYDKTSKHVQFSLSLEIGQTIEEHRETYFTRGKEWYQNQKYYNAQKDFARALEYDPEDGETRKYLNFTNEKLKGVKNDANNLVKEGVQLEKNEQYLPAAQKYAGALNLYPSHTEAHEKLSTIRPKLDNYINQKVRQGERSLEKGQYTMARKHLNQVLTIDPENSAAKRLLSKIDNSLKSDAKGHYKKGKNYFNNNDYENARKEFENAEDIYPNYKETRNYLELIKSKSSFSELLQKGTEAFQSKNYETAILKFSTILEIDPGNSTARSYIQQCRDALKSKVNEIFNAGLKAYSEEDYEIALSEWKKVLIIDPNHGQTIEYKKRAMEKLKALEGLDLNQ